MQEPLRYIKMLPDQVLREGVAMTVKELCDRGDDFATDLWRFLQVMDTLHNLGASGQRECKATFCSFIEQLEMSARHIAERN